MAERQEGLWMSAKGRERLKVLHEVKKRHITQRQSGAFGPELRTWFSITAIACTYSRPAQLPTAHSIHRRLSSASIPTARSTRFASGLFFPIGLTLGPDGNLYVSNPGFGPPPVGLGQILKITPAENKPKMPSMELSRGRGAFASRAQFYRARASTGGDERVESIAQGLVLIEGWAETAGGVKVAAQCRI
jgi:hypothetical protein